MLHFIAISLKNFSTKLGPQHDVELTVMDKKMLDDLLRAIVRHYGFTRVNLALRKLQNAGDEHAFDRSSGRSVGNKQTSSRAESKQRPKVTAPLYVEKLNVPTDVRECLVQLAQMFEDKLFLSTMKDVKDFSATYGIDVPATSSRAASIPRVFRFLSTLAAADIQQVVHSTQQSGPARLAPIADAIRRNSRQNQATDKSDQQEREKIGDDMESTSDQSGKPSVPREI